MRGSYPVEGEAFSRFGGATACVAVESAQGMLIIDAGTGITALGEQLCRRKNLPPLTILFTHFHLDHILGLPSFPPLQRADAVITLVADASFCPQWRERLEQIAGRPYWPVGLQEQQANVRFEDLPEGAGAAVCAGIPISRCPVQHPQGSLAFRLALPEGDLVYATDRESVPGDLEASFIAFARGARWLVHDAQYTPEEYALRQGWGHSTWQHAAAAAEACGARELVLTSHDPTHDDKALEVIAARTQERFAATISAQAGMLLA